jgi:glycosyltransferase involved in cell wall biosynthesis
MNRRAILVLGMHRSGTSALTRIIGHLGASLPIDPMPETADNPCGYWESRSVARFNNRLLESAGTRWSDDAPLCDAWFADPARAADDAEAAALLAAAFGEATLLVLKDPRVCRLLPFWSNVLARASIEPYALLALRDPLEVARSLQARLGDASFRPAAVAAVERGLLLWLRYVLDAEARSRGMPRSVIDYAALIADWRSAVRGLVEGVPLPTITFEGATAIDGFLSPGLRRQRGPAADDNGTAAVVEALRRIGADVIRAVEPGVEQAAAQHRLDALSCSYDRLSTASAPFRQGPAATTVRDPWAERILTELAALPPASPPPPPGSRVLFLSGAPRSAGHVYRVEHAVAALAAEGWRASWLPLDDAGVPAAVGEADLVTVFRATWGEPLAEVRKHCRARGIPLVHDIDDLVFDPAVITAGQIAFIDRLPEDRRQRWLADAALHRRALAESDACVVTTPGLAVAAAAVSPLVHVLPNGLSPAMLAAADDARSGAKPSAVDGRLRVGFASGTPTHHRDFATIAPALVGLLARRGDFDLVIVGHFDLAAVPELAPYAARIEIRPAVSLLGLHAEVARFDVNLAPLETGNPFCEAKSPIRCTTAALVAVPSVVAATEPLEAAVIDGETGLVARSIDDWETMIARLLDEPAGRTAFGAAARIDVIARFGPDAIRDRAGRVYAAILADHSHPIPECFAPPA